MKKIAIIIVNWNGWKDTLVCFKTLLELQVAPTKSRIFGRSTGISYKLQIIVIDNGSSDASVENLKKLQNSKTPKLQFELIENQTNLGFAEGNNIGIKKALDWGADYVVLLNNDTLVDKNLVDSLIEIMEGDKKIDILGPKIYFAPGYEFHKDYYKKEEQGKVIWYAGGKIDWDNVYCSHRGVDEIDEGQYDKQKETDFVSGCCMMIKKKVFDKIGFLDKKYFLYLEDVDFCIRAKQTGFKIVYTPKAHLWHKNASSSEKPGSKIHLYYQTRNRLYFGLKYAPTRSKLALFRESIKFIINNGIKRKACLDFYFNKFSHRKFD